MEKVFSIVRQTYGRSPTDDLNDFDVNTAVWCIFMSVTLQAAVHLGQDYSGNLRKIKNRPLSQVFVCPRLTGTRAVHIVNSQTYVFAEPSKYVKQLFRTTEKLIKIMLGSQVGPRLIGTSSCGDKSSLLCDGAVRIMQSKTYGAMSGRHQSRTSSSLERPN